MCLAKSFNVGFDLLGLLLEPILHPLRQESNPGFLVLLIWVFAMLFPSLRDFGSEFAMLQAVVCLPGLRSFLGSKAEDAGTWFAVESGRGIKVTPSRRGVPAVVVEPFVDALELELEV
jgi:hypothetical protein